MIEDARAKSSEKNCGREESNPCLPACGEQAGRSMPRMEKKKLDHEAQPSGPGGALRPRGVEPLPARLRRAGRQVHAQAGKGRVNQEAQPNAPKDHCGREESNLHAPKGTGT